MESKEKKIKRKKNVYVRKELIDLGGEMFMNKEMIEGIKKEMKKGKEYMKSFIVVFMFKKNIGGMIG